MQLFELLTFTLRVRTVPEALLRLEQSLREAGEGVHLMGCWVSEIGSQNRIAVLRGFDDGEFRERERERYLLAVDGFGIGAFLLGQQVDDYSAFAFIEPLPPGVHGPFYELREYNLVPSGLAPTLQGWGKAVARRTGAAYSQVYAAFYATSGQIPRYLHIWPYSSLEQRLEVRTRCVADGAWPPENSAPQLLQMHSTVYLPAPFSPLR
ncbi:MULTISPECIES: NIPSNAP family protein [unclassified Pseudomonas]|uniref:NIPSNAP family protein n=1 Tax=unclassified Pseudomonas TaxID=196821 RepID=UPI0008843E13|nr:MULTISPECIES: NIPSNAP family protein [unclassified Pseudomonas]SCY74460.1 NIPSNAP protein [Pseudomonas sp. NFACC37-1]SFN92109.1 NIPSNAP protein [Pseudomonas sp. NFACC24-1]